MSVNFDYIKTKPGKFKAICVVIGLLAVAFTGAGHDKQGIAIVKKDLKCPSDVEFMRCPQIWTAEMAMSIVILAWLFSIVMLVMSLLPQMASQSIFPKVDYIGHLSAGIALIVASLLIILWIVNQVIFARCDKDLSPYQTKSECLKLVFDEGKGYLWIIGLVMVIPYAILSILLAVMVKKQGSMDPGHPILGGHQQVVYH